MSASDVMHFCRNRCLRNQNDKDWMLSQTRSIITTTEQYAISNCGRSVTHIPTWRIRKYGRECLRRGLERAGIDFFVRGNKFLYIADSRQAQELLDEQLNTQVPNLLNG